VIDHQHADQCDEWNGYNEKVLKISSDTAGRISFQLRANWYRGFLDTKELVEIDFQLLHQGAPQSRYQRLGYANNCQKPHIPLPSID
jgi:hypothetical protein